MDVAGASGTAIWRTFGRWWPVAVALGLSGHSLPAQGRAQPSTGRVAIASLRTLLQADSGPVLSLGGESTRRGHDFARVIGGAWISRGRIAIADAGINAIRIFDETGQLVSQFGGKGRGPGEFMAGPTHLGIIRGDSIMVYDPLARQFSVFDGSGKIARTMPFDRARYPGDRLRTSPWPGGALFDGSYLVRVIQEPDSVGVERRLSEYYSVRPDGRIVANLGAARGGGLIRVPAVQRTQGTTAAVTLKMTVRLETVWRPENVAVHRDRVAFLDDSTATARVVGADGRAVFAVSWDEIPLWRRPPLPLVTGQVAELGFLFDDAGRLWVELYRTPAVRRSTWMIVDRQGRAVGTAVLPAGGRVLAFRGDQVLTHRRNDDGLDVIEVFRLQAR